MQHFVSFHLPQANFVNLSDKNLNKARSLILQAKEGKLNEWATLSKLNTNKLSPAGKVHDELQHPLIKKSLYKAATGVNPNTFFETDSPQHQTKLMPLTQNKNLTSLQKDTVNETTEKLVDIAMYPRNKLKDYVALNPTLPINPNAVLPYIRKNFDSGRRLAAMSEGDELTRLDNKSFRNKYIAKMKNTKNRTFNQED